MITGGNPFKKWSPLDFEIGKEDIKVEYEGNDIFYKSSGEKENQITFTITGNDFNIKVSGFDVNRDLAVDVNRNEVLDAQI